MTAFEIYSAVGGVGEDILEESEIMPKKKVTKIVPLMAAAACFAVLAVGLSHTLRNDNIEQPVTGTTVPAITFETRTETDSGEAVTGGNTGTYVTPSDDEEITVTETSAPADETTMNLTTSDIPENELYGTMPPPFGTSGDGTDTGGDQNAAFYLPCSYILNDIPVELLRLRDSGEVTQWLEKDKLSSRQSAPDSISDYVNIYTFIEHFNITREEAETALEYYLNTSEEFEHITYEDLDVIFSGDIGLITKTFASKYSIVVGDKIYTPEWLYVHSPEEYKAVGITPEDVLSRVEFYTDIYFTDEARQAFSEKLSEFTGEQVYIKPMVSEEKEDIYNVEDDVPEDVSEDFEIIDEEVVPVEYP